MSVVQKLWRLKISIEKSYMITLNVNNKMDTRHFNFFKIDLDRGHICDSNGIKKNIAKNEYFASKNRFEVSGRGDCGCDDEVVKEGFDWKNFAIDD